MSRNANLLHSFRRYCEANPDERFWQALRNWSGFAYIFAGNLNPQVPDGLYVNHPFTVEQLKVLAESLDLQDTFYWEHKLITKNTNEKQKE